MRSATFSNWFVVIVFSCAAAMAAEPARIIYVDGAAGGSGGGSSWADACKYLQDALALAETADKPVEIRVAQGIYKPDQGAGVTPGGRAATFQLLNGVTLKGGYAGITSPDPDVRDIKLHETVLSGDLAGNDGLASGDNSLNVVVGSSTDGTAVIDGFSITAGCATSSGGGGMLIDAGSPTVLNCRFSGNMGSRGALAACNGSNPIVTNCEFSNNQGRGMRNSDNSNPVLTNCRFEGNGFDGMENHKSSPIITDCQFIGNAARAIYAWDCNSVLTNCTFEGRDDQMLEEGIRCINGNLTLTECTFSHFGGGAIDASGVLKLVRCAFRDNMGLHHGAVDCSFGGYVTALECTFVGNGGFRAGAISGGSMELHDCEFVGNWGLLSGAIDCRGDVLLATGCVFSGNSSEHGAGAISGWAEIVKLSNCTFVGNRGRGNILDTWRFGPLPAQFTQCIIWDGPEPFGDYPWGPTSVDITYSNVQGGWPGEGNIDVDPGFVDPGCWTDPNDPNALWIAGDYHLKSQAGRWDRATETWVRDDVTSACIDAGNPMNPLGVEPFPNGGVINMGAYGGSGEASKSFFGEPPCEIQIPGDINGDCVVDLTDVDILLAHWLMEASGLVNNPPTITLISPEEGAELTYPVPIVFRAEAADPDGTVLRVKYTLEYRTANMRSTGSTSTIDPTDNWDVAWSWSNVRYSGQYTMWAEAMDDEGAKTVSPKITVTLHPNPASQ